MTATVVGDDFIYNYGVEGGVNFSNVSLSPNANTDNKLGAIVGGYWEFFLADFFSVLPGGYLVGKGHSEESSNRRVVLNYGQLRFLGRVSFYRTQSSRFFLDFGGGGEFIMQKGTQNFTSSFNLDLIENNDVSLMGGLGYEMAITKEVTLGFNIKYHYGLINIFKIPSGIPINIPLTVHSHGIMVTTAIQFSSKKVHVVSTEERARDFLNQKKETEY